MAFDWEAFKKGLTGSPDWADSDDLARMSIESFRAEGGGLRRDASSGSLRLTGSGIQGHSGSIDGIAETLRNLQRLVLATGLASTGHRSLRGQPPADVVAKTRLSLSGSPLPGSLVLQLGPATSPSEEIAPAGQAGLFGDTEDQLVDTAVKDALRLLDEGRRLGPDVVGSAFLSDLTARGPRVASTLRDFTTSLVKFGFEPDIAWAQPRRPRLRTRLSTTELAYIGQVISSRELELEPTTIRGMLRTVSEIAAWQLEVGDGEIVKIDARGIPKAQPATLGTGAIVSIYVNVTEESGTATRRSRGTPRPPSRFSVAKRTTAKREVNSLKTMESSPNLMQLRRRAKNAGRLIVKSRQRDTNAADYGLYALVAPDFQGRGSDPRGENAAAAAFESGNGMTLDEIAKELDVL